MALGHLKVSVVVLFVLHGLRYPTFYTSAGAGGNIALECLKIILIQIEEIVLCLLCIIKVILLRSVIQ